MFQDKVFVGLDNAIPEFNVKEKLQGPGVIFLLQMHADLPLSFCFAAVCTCII